MRGSLNFRHYGVQTIVENTHIQEVLHGCRSPPNGVYFAVFVILCHFAEVYFHIIVLHEETMCAEYYMSTFHLWWTDPYELKNFTLTHFVPHSVSIKHILCFITVLNEFLDVILVMLNSRAEMTLVDL